MANEYGVILCRNYSARWIALKENIRKSEKGINTRLVNGHVKRSKTNADANEAIELQIESLERKFEELLENQKFRLKIKSIVGNKINRDEFNVEGNRLHECELLEKKCKVLTSELEVIHEVWEKWNDKHNRAKSEILSRLRLYECLGLEFVKEHGNILNLCFTCINENDPNKKYVISLHVDDDQFEVVDVEPEISDTKSLEAELNQTLDFKAFVSLVRKEFCRLSGEDI